MIHPNSNSWENAMSVSVDIGDRLYDYTDEEAAAAEVALFQHEKVLDDEAVLNLWTAFDSPLKAELEKRIYAAIDANGSVQRAQMSIPGDLTLYIEA